MPNPVLTRLCEQRDQQIEFVNQMLERVDADDRDLVDAERANLTSARERIGALNDQIGMLQEFDALADAHTASVGRVAAPRVERQARPVTEAPTPEYRSAGAYLVDYIRARGVQGVWSPDPAAQTRIAAVQARAAANQITSDTPGILPQPIVGGVVNLIDANRPLITSLGGAKAMGGIPGTQFTRPKITQHTQSGKQTAEKTSLPSRKMTIGSVTFTKETHGGTVDISRQDMDWTSPAAWDILINDLANQYALDTEAAVATSFATFATGIKPPALPATPVLADWTKALYTAAMHSYQAGQRMPARIWCSLDVWAALGSLVDTARVVLPADAAVGGDATDPFDAGGSTLANFRGDVLGLPRVVVPLLPAKTCIVGPADLFEAYEEVIGLLSVVEPDILGVTVSYGGYIAYGPLAGGAYVPLDLSAVTSLPTAEDVTE